ncbi:hypothetical protein [Pseudostreptobacillus hongkongensis]|uniref:hypothetical protein n=1 Tax=Pseudostreptobacillus hongkongensis TaxID=1162717 RepID=UPI0008309EB9|nr:hypothetical protein [Pseudostreptobacillus hongkongensis]
MRTMLLSFRYDVFQRVISGRKIYEHRRSFPDEPVKAYVYVSRPMQAICGIMYLSNKTSLLEWKEKYKEDMACVGRIEEYLKQHKYGMEINEFVFTNAIPLDDLKRDLSKFLIPRSYYYIEDTELLEYLEKNMKIQDKSITHSFENTSSDMICKS